jgi:hypothetical protein
MRIMKSCTFSLLILLALSPSAGCRHGQHKGQGDFQDFVAFYERFHEDSLFQMRHIIFPLQGLPPEVDSATLAEQHFRWERDNWVMHRPLPVEGGEFTREFVPYTDDLIVERIVHHSGALGMLRRWARIDGQWTLIYFADMNRLRTPDDSGINIEGGFEE